jgi:glycosyltransferase involved in cell wall biosynthesis
MLEAMACGTPVLALPGGSVREVIEDGVNGFICCSLDEMAARARAVCEALAPARVRQCVAQHFSLEHMAARYAKLYQSILTAGERAQISALVEGHRAVA